MENLVTQKVLQVVDLVKQQHLYTKINIEVESSFKLCSDGVDRLETGNLTKFEKGLKTDWNLY